MVRVNRSMRRSKSYRNKNQKRTKRTKRTKTKRTRTRSKSQIRRKRGGSGSEPNSNIIGNSNSNGKYNFKLKKEPQKRLLPGPQTDQRAEESRRQILEQHMGLSGASGKAYPKIQGHVYVKKVIEEGGEEKYFISSGMGETLYTVSKVCKFDGIRLDKQVNNPLVVFKLAKPTPSTLDNRNVDSGYKKIKANFLVNSIDGFSGPLYGILVFPPPPEKSYETFVSGMGNLDVPDENFLKKIEEKTFKYDPNHLS